MFFHQIAENDGCNLVSDKYSEHRLIEPLVIQPTHLIRPFPLDTLHWLSILKATLNSTPTKFCSETAADYEF